MESINTDVAIAGAGGAGLRAAVAEADPSLKIALISNVYPMRCRAQDFRRNP
jgi:fumarate reductase flavoprotein subunit